MYSSRILAIAAALVILMLAAPAHASAQELSPTTRTEPAATSPPAETC